jgi:hypothetical protein
MLSTILSEKFQACLAAHISCRAPSNHNKEAAHVFPGPDSRRRFVARAIVRCSGQQQSNASESESTRLPKRHMSGGQ